MNYSGCYSAFNTLLHQHHIHSRSGIETLCSLLDHFVFATEPEQMSADLTADREHLLVRLSYYYLEIGEEHREDFLLLTYASSDLYFTMKSSVPGCFDLVFLFRV